MYLCAAMNNGMRPVTDH